MRQAVDEAKAALPGLRVEGLRGNHQNKPNASAGLARQWFDREGVDAIVEVLNTTVRLAVGEVACEEGKVFLASGPATTELMGLRCAPTVMKWTFDTHMHARSTRGALVQSGHKSWSFLTADCAFGKILRHDATKLIKGAGGCVLGNVSYPVPETSDFSCFLLEAQASGAKVLAFANTGVDTINPIKQAAEFGLVAAA